MTRIRYAFFLLLLLTVPATQAQEGHPLVGTWQGNWGVENNFLTIIMNWDGQRISGIVNPGPNSSRIESVFLESSNWHVEMDLPIKDEAGNTETLQLDGRLEEVVSRTRSLNGTWRYQGRNGRFTLTRQSGA